MGEPLTKKQKQILDYIAEFIANHGYAPSYQEIASYMGLKSRATIFQHIRTLEDKGHLRAHDHRARMIEVVDSSAQFAHTMQAIELPLVGLIAAGEPIEAIEEKETISVPARIVRNENAYVLKVKGTSMIDEGIFDGDYVIVERNFYPKNGDVVVALLDNAYATLKKYYREQHQIRLQPANKRMKPIFAKNPVIQGIVRGIFRVYGAAI
ncbi:MAG: transcriptional repressor LexA [Candidatus Kerfeldbacteria bacterium]|nr:transcriptional repressor LexA [Candidatus Kerfeldbacteria bacterium]